MQVNIVLALSVLLFIYLFIFDAKIRWPADAFRSIYDVKNEGDDRARPRQRHKPAIYLQQQQFFFFSFFK